MNNDNTKDDNIDADLSMLYTLYWLVIKVYGFLDGQPSHTSKPID